MKNRGLIPPAELAANPRQPDPCAGGMEHAVALDCQTSDVPQVIVQGRGSMAKQIISIAEQHDIPVYRDETLSSMLASLDRGQAISPEAFRLMAEVICFLYDADRALAAA